MLGLNISDTQIQFRLRFGMMNSIDTYLSLKKLFYTTQMFNINKYKLITPFQQENSTLCHNTKKLRTTFLVS